MAEAQRYADISLCTKTIVQSDYNDIINSMYRGFIAIVFTFTHLFVIS
jgi:hypothetical protein